MHLDLNALPTPKEETWKYTDLRRAVPEGLAREESKPILIHKKRGEICGKPEEILFTGRDGILLEPRLTLILEEGAEMTLIERHKGQGRYWRNMEATIKLGPNAKLNHYRVMEGSAESVTTLKTALKLERDSAYNGFFLQAQARFQRNEIHAEIKGPNAACRFNGLHLLKGKEHGDTTILVEHQAPHCASSQFVRSILDGESRGVFQGKVLVHRAAQKTDASQLSNALLLSEKAEMDTKPELEIYADDVKCAHGATSGQLDAEPIFYLRSRGICEAEARFLLTQAFVGEVVDKIEDKAFRAEIEERAHQWLRSVL